jgi:energy-coupling factor transporter ATP-binding protein EcfA2
MSRQAIYFQNPAFATPESRYAQAKCAEWLLRLVEQGITLDSYFFACAGWTVGGLRPLLKTLAAENAKITGRGANSFKNAVKSALEESDHRLDDEFEDLVREHPAWRDAVVGLVLRKCQAAAAGTAKPCKTFLAATNELRRMFNISDGLASLCEMAYIQESSTAVEQYLEDHLELYKHAHRRILAKMLGMNSKTLQRSLDEAFSCGFFNTDTDCFRLDKEIKSFWEDGNTKDKDKLFYKELKNKALPLEKFHVPQDDIAHVLKLLQKSGEKPVHILLYGPAGMGKTTFAASLTAALKVKAWSVVSRQDDNESNRRTSLRACLSVSAKNEGSFVLVDEAERLLDTDNFFVRESKDKAWLNAFLEAPGRRIVWITNHVDHIDKAVRRRFAYSIHFDELGLKERKELWRQVLTDQKVATALSEPQIVTLARRYETPVAVIEKSVCQAVLVGAENEEFAPAVERYCAPTSS